MNFFKKTLLGIVIGTVIFIDNQTAVCTEDFNSMINDIFIRARKTSVVDLTRVDLKKLTLDEFKILTGRLANFSKDLKETFSQNIKITDGLKKKYQDKSGELDLSFEKQPIKMIVKIKLDGDRKDNRAYKYNDVFFKTLENKENKNDMLKDFIWYAKDNLQILPLNTNTERCWTAKSEYSDEYRAKLAINDAVDIAYDSGYIDLTSTVRIETALGNRSSFGYHKDTSFLARLTELAYTYAFDANPIYVLCDDVAYRNLGEFMQIDAEVFIEYTKKFIEMFLGKDFLKKFKFIDNYDKTKKYIKEYEDRYKEFAKKYEIVDLTNINFSGNNYFDVLEKLVDPDKRVNCDSRVIYLKEYKDYKFVKKVIDLASKRKGCICYEISYDDLYKIQQHLHAGCKTGKIVFDNDEKTTNSLLIPLMCKILFKGYNKVNTSKNKEKLKLTIYVNLIKDDFRHQEIKRRLQNDENLDVEIKEFDKQTYDKIQAKLLGTYDDNKIIDLDKDGLNQLDDSKLDLIMTCIENHLANNENEKSVQISKKVSKTKEQKKKDEKVLDRIKELKKKYKNLKLVSS